MGRTRTTTRDLAMLLLAGSLMAGCADSDEPEETTATAGTTPTQDAAPTTTEPVSDDAQTTTTAASPEDATTTEAPGGADLEDEGQEAAAQAVVAFTEMLDRLYQDPKMPVQDIAKVARGQAVQQAAVSIESSRGDGSVQTGDTVVTITEVETVTEGEEYLVTACLDWSDVKFDGVKPDRGEDGDRQQITYTVGVDPLSEGELFVLEDPMEYEPCDT